VSCPLGTDDFVVRPDLPSGTVTFCFTDVEGSTRLLHSLGAEAYAEALAEHRAIVREACAAEGGVEVDTQGDAFFFAFPTAQAAVAAASEITDTLASGPIQVRIGLHTGTPLLTDEGYVGQDVHFAARVAASGHGGQVLVSSSTAAFVDPSGSELQGLSLLDLGEHRLKDIEGPVSIFQLGGGSFPPIRTISNTNLPRPASSFVGREAELAEVLSRIEDGARLVTLTGPGGSGKTRLALEAASSLVPEYKAGVFWVGLASLRDSALVAETISQTLGAKDGLAEHIAEREMLLLLDNLEQVIEAAPELSSLLSTCPNLTLLVTSRELLRIQGEVEYAVPPLAEPEAVSLFCDRAQVEPSEEIAELCARLDNLPLAVELAAARAKALSPAQILERLSQRLDLLKGGRDADPRQQTLRATIEWSYDLLSEEEQQLFARLSVFAGGSTLEAVEEVCDADLDSLQSLVEKSLLRFTQERYWMLETIKEYAAERFVNAETNMNDRHSTFYLQFAVVADSHIRSDEQIEWQRRFEADYANCIRALHTLVEQGCGDQAAQLAVSLSWYWLVRGRLREARDWLERVVAMAVDDERRFRALIALSGVALSQGEPEAARVVAERALAIARAHSRPDLLADALVQQAHAAMFSSPDRALHLHHEARALYAQLGDSHGLVAHTINLGNIALIDSDYATAAALSEEGAARARELGNRDAIGIALRNLAISRYFLGDINGAQEACLDALDAVTAIDDHDAMSLCLDILAAGWARNGRSADATRLLETATLHRAETGYALEIAEARLRADAVSVVARALGPSELEAALNSGTAMNVDEAVEYALASID
jgi:predicted ATPase/class 3 adenylate cyclase